MQADQINENERNWNLMLRSVNEGFARMAVAAVCGGIKPDTG